jgi:hypothetical protein
MNNDHKTCDPFLVVKGFLGLPKTVETIRVKRKARKRVSILSFHSMIRMAGVVRSWVC